MSESKDTVVCPACQGSGRLDGGTCMPSYTCDVCGGSGRVPAPKKEK
jgi:DnaJ-class molecular chaperone